MRRIVSITSTVRGEVSCRAGPIPLLARSCRTRKRAADGTSFRCGAEFGRTGHSGRWSSPPQSSPVYSTRPWSEVCARDTQKTESLESLKAKFAGQKCPCDWPRRCSQIIQFVIRFEAPKQRTACPVAKKAISANRESYQSVARLGNANFGLVGHEHHFSDGR